MNISSTFLTNVDEAALAMVGENSTNIMNMPTSSPPEKDDDDVVAINSMGDMTATSKYNNIINSMTKSDHTTTTKIHSKRQNQILGTTTTTSNVNVANDHTKQEEANRFQVDDTNDNVENAVSSTIQMLHSVIDRIIQQEILEPMMAIPVMQQQQLDEMMESHRQSTTLAAQNHTDAFMNLQQVVQESQTQLQDVTQSIRNEARLRAELSDMTSQRNEAMGQMEEQKHKVSLLLEQMTDLKIKIARYQQDKMQSERHLQHLMIQQQSQHVDGGTTTTQLVTPSNATSGTYDAEFYQRKYNESNQKVQSYQSMMIEKNRQIDELRYQVERNLNQQQYTILQRQNGRLGPELQQQNRSSMSSQFMESSSLATSSKRQRM